MKDDGGPAFPVPETVALTEMGNQYHSVSDFTGMTLRDYFAAKAMQALIILSGSEKPSNVSGLAYRQADAMLKVREE